MVGVADFCTGGPAREKSCLIDDAAVFNATRWQSCEWIGKDEMAMASSFSGEVMMSIFFFGYCLPA